MSIPEHVRKLIGRIDMYRMQMSYNDSYFGEPAGLLKGVFAELSHAVNPIYPSGKTAMTPTLAAPITGGLEMKTPHPHAELLHAIADVGIEAAAEFQCIALGLERQAWRGASQYINEIIREPERWQVRRKPRTVKIGKREVQAGITEAPECGQTYWVASPSNMGWSKYNAWYGCEYDKATLERGLIHLSEEPARAMGEALAIVAKGEE